MPLDHTGVSADELRRLLRELSGDLLSRRRFVRTYVEMWPTRLARLTAAIATADLEETKVVLFSIRSSSVMLGVTGLAELAAEGLAAVDRQDLAGCARVRDELAIAGDVSCARLLELEAAESMAGR
ncbi:MULTISPECIES: hypothetical protein [unclassified Plantibacter]|jgi:hypothetical protein|uniref:hypothetical protein n=1 Tax=unclassified Plantibacter TaxID=2624265 RepID=UPI003D3408B7